MKPPRNLNLCDDGLCAQVLHKPLPSKTSGYHSQPRPLVNPPVSTRLQETLSHGRPSSAPPFLPLLVTEPKQQLILTPRTPAGTGLKHQGRSRSNGFKRRREISTRQRPLSQSREAGRKSHLLLKLHVPVVQTVIDEFH